MALQVLVPSSLQNAMHEILDRCNVAGAYIRAVLLSTTEGVPLGRCISIDEDHTSLNEDVLISIESIWAPASKQFPVLGLGKLQISTAMYDHGTVVQVYQTPLVITILCGPQSNIGAVRTTAVPLLKKVLEPLSRELVKMLHVDTDETSMLLSSPTYNPNANPNANTASLLSSSSSSASYYHQ